MTSPPPGPQPDARHDLEKVDVLRERLEASYSEAKAALDATGGDVVGALALIEIQRGQARSSVADFVQEVITEARKVMAGAPVTSAKVSLRGQPLFTTSLALVGIAGAVLVVAGALISQCRVEVAVGEGEAGEGSRIETSSEVT
jgi:hypothetical protein